MEKVFVVQQLTKQLWTTEAAVDAALVEAAALLRDVTNSRKDLKVSAIFADGVNVKLMEAMQALTEARTAMVAVHGEMEEARLRLGVRTKMDWSKPPTSASLPEELREVG